MERDTLALPYLVIIGGDHSGGFTSTWSGYLEQHFTIGCMVHFSDVDTWNISMAFQRAASNSNTHLEEEGFNVRSLRDKNPWILDRLSLLDTVHMYVRDNYTWIYRAMLAHFCS